MRPVKTLLAVAVLVALGGGGAWCGQAQAGASAEENEVGVTGTYRNAKYAYSVQVPAGLRAYRMKAPAPNHGIAMHAPGNDTDLVWVDGSFDAAGYGSAGAYAKWLADVYRTRNGLSIVGISRTVLSNLDAREATLKGTATPGRGGQKYVHLVVAFRRMGHGNTPVIYTIGVQAHSSDSAVVKAFPAVVESFRTLPWN
jgi:hypothetical protein